MPYPPGRCHDCGVPVVGRFRCAACARAHAEKTRALRDQRRAAGLCITCGLPVAESKLEGVGPGRHRRVHAEAVYCAKHLALLRAKYRAKGRQRG